MIQRGHNREAEDQIVTKSRFPGAKADYWDISFEVFACKAALPRAKLWGPESHMAETLVGFRWRKE